MSDTDQIDEDPPLLEMPIEAFDSEIESAFFWEFRKVANDDIRMRTQEECRTARGTYWLDFVFFSQISGNKIAVECDGKQFHSATTDMHRDAAILKAGNVNRIVRIAGKDILYRPHDVFQMISCREPWLFSDRGREIIDTRAARDHQHEDSWETGLDKFYMQQIRWYDLPDPEGEVSYESERHEYTPTKILWAISNN